MSRKDEIMEIMKDSVDTITQPPDSECPYAIVTKQVDYKYAAIKIEKLFEVEGKVEYIIQHFYPGDAWYTVSEKIKTLEYTKKLKKDKESKFLNHKFRIIKRTTTDQIIEE